MPFEDRSRQVLEALTPARSGFHSALVAAVEELRSYIASHRPPTDSTATAAAQLGEYSQGRIDAAAFGALFAHAGSLTPEELARLAQAQEALREFAEQGDDLFRIQVPAGVDLRDSVRSALAVRGRAFAVARGAEVIRRGGGPAESADEPGGFPFRLWNRAERQIAPALVIEVGGGDLQVNGLAEYLDGRMKIVLVVQEPSPGAPLTRLIAPHVFVQQTTDPAALASLVAFDGPAIAALLPAGCATFTWDPSAGPRFEQRLRVEHVPAEEPQHAVGTVGVAQQHADLQWLRELSELRARAAAAVTDEAGVSVLAQPADLLAAWLLRQSVI